jgi:predicted nuclease of predicted toxin-antitoxin system
MKSLLNMNLPRELGKLLSTRGHTYRHVGDIGMARASDLAIVEQAKANQEIIVTHDLDYGNLLAFSGETSPSVIIFRVRNTHPTNLFNRMIKVWVEIEKPLREGAIVVLEDATLRILKLPIADQEELQ